MDRAIIQLNSEILKQKQKLQLYKDIKAKSHQLLLTILEQYAIKSINFNNTGTILASGSEDNTIKLWNIETKTEIATLIGHESGVKSVAFNTKIIKT